MNNASNKKPNSTWHDKPGWRLCLAGVLSWLLALGATAVGQTADQLVTTGRVALVQHDIGKANAAFQHALNLDPNNQDANFFYAFTRIAVLVNVKGPGTVSGLLDGFGVSASGRNLWNWTADFKRNLYHEVVLPSTTPKSGVVIGVLTDVLLPQVTGALTNLSLLNADYSVTLAGEIGRPSNPATVTNADVVLAQSGLETLRAALLTLSSYNLNINILDLAAKIHAMHHSNSHQDLVTYVLAKYPELLSLLPNATSALPAAGVALNSAASAVSNAWQLVLDQQGRYLFSPDKLQQVQNLQTALVGQITISPGGQSVPIGLAPFFDAQLDVRSDLPTIQNDPNNNNRPAIVADSFADPTLAGILPAATQQWWIDLLQNKFEVITLTPVATPTIVPASGSYTDLVRVALSCATPGAKIYYTVDGFDPDTTSTRFKKKKIKLTEPTVTVEVRAFKAGMRPSSVVSATYQIVMPTIITPESLLPGTLHTAYGPVQLNAVNGTLPYKWALAHGRGNKLPAGLKLSRAGVIRGKPRKIGAFSFTVMVTDAQNGFGTKTFLLTVN